MPVESAPWAVPTMTNPMTNSSHTLEAATKAKAVANIRADSATNRLRPIKSEPIPASRLPRIPPIDCDGKIIPIAASVKPVAKNSVVIDGMTDGMRIAAVPMNKYPMRPR
jgi:hypothetical protein